MIRSAPEYGRRRPRQTPRAGSEPGERQTKMMIAFGVATAIFVALAFGFHYMALRHEVRELRAHRASIGSAIRSISAQTRAEDEARRTKKGTL